MSPVDPGGVGVRPPVPVPVLNVRDKMEMVRLLGGFVGVVLHWCEGRGRSVPHREPACEECASGNDRNLYGYAPALHKHRGSGRVYRVVLCVPWSSAAEFAPPLRGKVYALSRDPQDPYRPLSAIPKPDLTREPEEPEFDILPHVARTLGVRPDVLVTFDWDAGPDVSSADAPDEPADPGPDGPAVIGRILPFDRRPPAPPATPPSPPTDPDRRRSQKGGA